jgi:hypothetical protein
MPIRQRPNGHALFPTKWPANLQLVANAQQPVRLGRDAVDRHLAGFARLLRFGPRAA